MAEALDMVIKAAEDYKLVLQQRLEEFESSELTEPAKRTLARQLGRAKLFIETIDDQVLEQLREMVNGIETLELAARGEFV